MTTEEKQRILWIVGGVSTIGVLLIVLMLVLDVRALVQNALPAVQQTVDDTVRDSLPVVRPPAFDAYGNPILTEEDFMLPQDVAMRGWVTRGGEVTGTIGMYRKEGWMYEAQADETLRLDLDPRTIYAYWEMTVYQPDHTRLTMAADNDAGYADFSLLDVTFPTEGTYFIVLWAFGENGDYSLRVD